MTINRSELIIREGAIEPVGSITITNIDQMGNSNGFAVERVKKFSPPAHNELYLDPRKLVFPLTLRLRAEGDRFQPFGMKGFKLVSDFFKERKLSHYQRQATHLLVNGNGDIIWVVGHRSDERYRVDELQTDLIKITSRD